MSRGNRQRKLHVAGGYEDAPDQVKRRDEFLARHPWIVITSPRQNKTGEYKAARADGADIEDARHTDLGCLLNYLVARFDNSTTEGTAREPS